MATMIIRSILGLFVCAALSACGSGKGGGAPVRMGANSKTQNQNKDQSAADHTEDQAGDQNENTVAKSDAKESKDKKDTKTAAKADKKTKAANVTDTTGSANTVRTVPSSTSSTKSTNSATASKKSTTSTTANKASASQEKKEKKSAGLSEKDIKKMKDEAAHYTGASADYVRNYLIDRESNLSAEKQNANLKMANAVQSANLGIDYDSEDGTGSGDVVLRLKLKQDGKESQVTLGGELDSSLRARLEVVDGSMKLKGELICLDRNDGLNKTCETSVATIQGPAGNSIKVIFRRTNVALAEFFNMKTCPTKECFDIYGMFSQSHANEAGYQKALDRLIIEKTKMETYEIINGRSEFRILILTTGVQNQTGARTNKQLITFGAPLYNQSLLDSADPQLAANRAINPEDQMNYKTGSTYLTNLNRTLKDIRIVSNDGVGDITAIVTIGNQDASRDVQMQLDVTRKFVEVRPMEDTRLK